MTGKPQPPFDEPMTAQPVDGEVAITGPGHIHGSMTPQAAKESADHLQRVAEEAEQENPSGTAPSSEEPPPDPSS